MSRWEAGDEGALSAHLRRDPQRARVKPPRARGIILAGGSPASPPGLLDQLREGAAVGVVLLLVLFLVLVVAQVDF